MIRTRNFTISSFLAPELVCRRERKYLGFIVLSLNDSRVRLFSSAKVNSTHQQSEPNNNNNNNHGNDDDKNDDVVGRKIQSTNATLFAEHPALKRTRIKSELKPLLSLAIHQKLLQKQNHELTSEFMSLQKRDLEASVELLAQWNGYEEIKDPARIIVTPEDKGRIPLGRGLVAEASPFAAENYRIYARPRRTIDHQDHPDFILEDFSWYRSLERRINDALDRWEERARDRRQRRRQSAKEQLQRTFDAIQAPAADLFFAITARLGPVVDFSRRLGRRILPAKNPTPPVEVAADSDHQEDLKQSTNNNDVQSTSADGEIQERQSPSGTSGHSDFEVTFDHNDGPYSLQDETQQEQEWNRNYPEDLIIIARDEKGTIVLLLDDVFPSQRLLALPGSSSFTDPSAKKIKPAYRLRLARGGLVITCSLIFLGTIPPAYRSLRFILEYPRTAEVVMITLVGSVAYSFWSWATSAKTEQERLIAAAVQSRLVARNKAAVAYLTEGAVDNLTHILMEEYVSRLVGPKEVDPFVMDAGLYAGHVGFEGQEKSDKRLDPLVVEIGLDVGLLEYNSKASSSTSNEMFAKEMTSRKSTDDEILAVKWDKAQSQLLRNLADK